ncbi:MAG: photosynthetic reaction center cytochrome PufC [Pseudomonadota bacterium]
MLPKWFDEWNSKNPTNIYKPAIVIGAVGGAVFVTALLVTWGQPLATDSLQTGPRGTGMSVAKFESDLATPDPTIEVFLQSDTPPVVPVDGAQSAGDAYENVDPLLADLTVENYDRLLAAMRSWTGIPDLLEDPENYQSKVALNMIQMTQFINEEWAAHVYANAEVGVNCFTCHRGQPVPSEIWFRIDPVNEATAGWASRQNRATEQSQFTSLPSDALYQYLLNYEQIIVHDLEPRVENFPGDPTWQDTERTFSLMNYFSNSLGRNCVFCHNSRAFYDPAQVTAQWATASLGIAMVQELNNDWIVPIGEEFLPEHRLGPVYGDAPKLACKTCHKGYQQPLQATNVVANWPELTSTDGPFYD